MIYLSGGCPADLPPTLGMMLSLHMGNRAPQDRIWAADNGCFASPEKYTDERYLAWLKRHSHARRSCLFATAPDVVGDGEATLDRSLLMFARIHGAGYRAGLVAQDGMEKLALPWEEFEGLFIGGTTDWKLGPSAAALIDEARQRGKWVHMGRVNSLKRLRLAANLGCHSADGTTIAFEPSVRAPLVASWVEQIAMQPGLF
jgi:hypothetical protein